MVVTQYIYNFIQSVGFNPGTLTIPVSPLTSQVLMLVVAATEARHRGREHPAAGGEERGGGGRADHGLAQRPRDQRGHDRARRRGGGRDDRMVARAVTRLAPDRPLTLVQQTAQPAPAFHL